jgi:SAGA-associated factor 29
MPEEDHRTRCRAGRPDRYVFAEEGNASTANFPPARGDSPSSRIDAELDSNLRENIKLSEEMLTLIKSERGNDICEQLSILSALRSADTDSSTSRATNTGKSRDRQNKRKLTDAAMDDRDSVAADSPIAPSPKILGKERLMQKSGSSRAGSAVPTVREGSVKGEDDKDDHLKGKKTRPSASPTKKTGGYR